MDAKQCDRCKGFYVQKQDNWDRLHFIKSIYKGVISEKTYFDLCPVCMDALREWLLTPGVKEGLIWKQKKFRV